MNKNPLTQDDLALIEQSRSITSRHMEIPPTPRDTLAVLQQAAEQAPASTSVFAGWLQWAAVALIAVAVCSTLVIRYHGSPSSEPLITTVALEIDTMDPGIDVAAWNIEVEAMMSNLDETLNQLTSDNADLNAMANGLLTEKDAWL